jgi:hypothetical protein
MRFFKELQGFTVFSLIDEGDIALDTDMGRAGGLARRGSPFGDGVAAWDRLRIEFESRFSRGEGFVVLIIQIDGADFDAFPAAGALGEVYVAWVLNDSRLEMTFFALKVHKLRGGQQFDV